jgi:peptidyl-tRNA hydrolase
MELRDYVLQRFSKDEMIEMNETLDKAAQSVVKIIESGVEIAMNRFNA